jgi:hypothetical protein
MSLFPAVVVNDNSVGAFSGMPVMSIVLRQFFSFSALTLHFLEKFLILIFSL